MHSRNLWVGLANLPDSNQPFDVVKASDGVKYAVAHDGIQMHVARSTLRPGHHGVNSLGAVECRSYDMERLSEVIDKCFLTVDPLEVVQGELLRVKEDLDYVQFAPSESNGLVVPILVESWRWNIALLGCMSWDGCIVSQGMVRMFSRRDGVYAYIKGIEEGSK